MSQEEECKTYNLISEIISKLVNMCGNTDEALELRSELLDLFTTKYSEPMFFKLGLEEELGFDLKKLQETSYIYAEDWENVLRKYAFIGVNFKEKKIWFWDGFTPMYLKFEYYKKSFWLKEDKSE